ncbi:MAG: F0F1 ATP synthase subunit gamma [Steroidobacteraceae bacterium]
MTDTTASLRKKISSAGELQSVVRTMKALAASSIGQYEQAVRALADYYHAVELGLGECFRQSKSMENLWHSGRPGKKVVGAVVFGSDQGLVGQFNEVIVEHALQSLATSSRPRIWAVGERVYTRLSDAGLSATGQFTVPNSVQGIAALIGNILVTSEAGSQDELTELHLFYNRFTSGSGYQPVSQQLLPLDDNWRRKLSELPWPPGNLPELLGDSTTTLRALIREYLFISLFRACAESLASENASRLSAMQRAEKNIDELLAQLHDTSHRVRQGSIDEELFDVVSGFEALS